MAIEWAVEAGHVHDRKSLVDWLEADLCYGSGRNEAIFFIEAWRCAIEMTIAQSCLKLRNSRPPFGGHRNLRLNLRSRRPPVSLLAPSVARSPPGRTFRIAFRIRMFRPPCPSCSEFAQQGKTSRRSCPARLSAKLSRQLGDRRCSPGALGSNGRAACHRRT